MHKPNRLPVVREDLFWEKVVVRGPDDCWLWTGSIQTKGYGQIKDAGVRRGAHRVMWEAVNGPIPKGLQVCHRCDNPPCVNPNHLFVGTNQDNVDDSIAKGRDSRGELSGSAKLTERDVIEIRRRYAAGGVNQTTLAEAFGVNQTSISAIVCRRSWTCVADAYDLV